MTATHLSRDPEFDNLMSPANIADPFPLYAVLRREDPVHWNAHLGTWQLSRYADVRAALGDHKQFSSAVGDPVRRWATHIPATSLEAFEIGMRFFYGQVQAMDAPSHTVHRASIAKAFTPRVMASMRASIQQTVDVLVDDILRSGECDFVKAFAYPLPSLVIFNLIGVPEEHHEHVRGSAAAFARFLPALAAGKIEELDKIAAKLRVTDTLLQDLIASRRAEPGNDLLSALAGVQEGDVSLTDNEIVVLSNFLLFAGHETTANLLAGSMVHLLTDRTCWNQLLNNPGLLPNAVEELLRFISPALTVGRVLKEDMTRHGTTMKAGDRVQLLIGSANHDESEFPAPETLLLDRPKTNSVAFGYGAHYCIGAALARMEAQISLSALQARIPRVKLAASTFEYNSVFFLRSFKSVPITLGD